jgi:acyl carrier protein
MTTMTTDQLRATVRQTLHAIVPDADVDALDPGADLRDELGLDSLDFLAFVERLGETTGVRIEEDDYDRLDTLEACVEFLGTRAA